MPIQDKDGIKGFPSLDAAHEYFTEFFPKRWVVRVYR
jgi:hypothetical protein